MWESRCVGTRRGAHAHSQAGLGTRPGERSVVSSLIHVLTYWCEHVSNKSYTTNPSVMSVEISPLCHPSFSIRTHQYKHTNLHAFTHAHTHTYSYHICRSTSNDMMLTPQCPLVWSKFHLYPLRDPAFPPQHAPPYHP